jgi:hypothetical protein
VLTTACIDPPLSELVTPFCFGDATQDQLDAFSAHLLECDYCWAEVQRLAGAIRVLRSDSEVSTSYAAHDVVEVMGVSARLKMPFGGHIWQALTAVCLYAALHPLALLAEVAYDFPHLGRAAAVASPFIFGWMAVTTLAAFAVVWRAVARRGRSGLVLASAILLGAALVLYGAVLPMLPAYPVVQANFQTDTAKAGFLKSILLSSPLAIPLLLAPFAAVLMLQRQLQDGRHSMVLALLTGEKRAVPPRGSIYVKSRNLWVLVFIVVIASIGGTIRLFEGLTPTPQMNLFMTFALVRSICYNALWVGACWWYSSGALVDIKRECVAVESVRSGRMLRGRTIR